jgi:hypothetical protein
VRNPFPLILLASIGVAAVKPGALERSTRPFVAVNGTVFDSIHNAVLSGARVQLVGASGDIAGRSFSATTDAAGRYAIPDVPLGSYVAGFFHPSLDTLGIETPSRRVEIRASAQINLATPSAKTLMQGICPTRPSDEPSALLIGHVRETDSEQPIVGAKVMVEWTETVIDGTGVRTRPRVGTVDTDGPGWFAICGLPADIALAARAARGADSSGFVEIELPEDGLRHVTLFVGGGALQQVGGPAAVTPDAPRTETRRAWRGAARVSGRVTDPRGQPVANAQVAVWGSDRDARTNETGMFTLDSLPGGTQTLEAKALGFTPVRMVVQLAENRPATADVKFTERAQVLSTVAVRGELLYSRHLAEFDRRRRGAFAGFFITPKELEDRPVVPLTSVLQDVPGVTTNVRSGSREIPVYLATVGVGDGTGPGATAGRNFCPPTLWVNGMPDRSNDYDRYRSDEIAAIEVYRRSHERPLELTDNNVCGAIAIWTRPRPVKGKERKR